MKGAKRSKRVNREQRRKQQGKKKKDVLQQINVEAEKFLKEIDYLELTRKIAKFRKLDFKRLNYQEIREAIYKVLLHNGKFVFSPHGATYPEGTKFFRVRALKESKIPKWQLSDFWSVPAHLAPALPSAGRLNKQGEALLYTSPINPFVAINEMKEDIEDFYVLIVYTAKQDIRVSMFCANGDYDVLRIKDVHAKRSHKIYDDFFKEEFCREVKRGEEYLYNISQLLIKDFHDWPREFQDAWAYPSVQDKRMFNACFRPELAKDLLQLDGGIVVKNENAEYIKAICITHGFDTARLAQFYEIGSEMQKRIFPEII